MANISDILSSTGSWSPPEVGADLIPGDMPGDKIRIGPEHIMKSEVVFRELLKQLPKVVANNSCRRAVIAVCGGSGVGKSETASLLSYYFRKLGIGSYTLSGDNYPRRIPRYNDAERLRLFRQGGVKALVTADLLSREVTAELRQLQEKEQDADLKYRSVYPWFQTYLGGGTAGLSGYLGTGREIDFDEITGIIGQFKQSENQIWLKRMGRTESELWYDKVNFTDIEVLIIEWTHGNSDHMEGVDIPVLLNSTPEETLAHRNSRNRDKKADSPFTMRVLEIEQQLLDSQAHKAKIIISKQGELLSFAEYQAVMAGLNSHGGS